MEPVPRPLHRLNKNRCSGQVQERVSGFPGPFSEVKVWRPTTFSLSSAMRFQRQRRRGFCLQEPGGGQYMPAFTLAGEAFCSVWTSTFHSLCTLPLPEEIGFEQEEIVAGRRLYRWGSMQGGSIAAPDDAAFLSAPCRSSKGGSIILHRQDPGPRQKDDLDDQRSAAMVDSDGGAFPAGWRNEATPCQQPATPEASLLFKAWKTIWLRSPQPRAMHGETKFPCFDDFRGVMCASQCLSRASL